MIHCNIIVLNDVKITVLSEICSKSNTYLFLLSNSYISLLHCLNPTREVVSADFVTSSIYPLHPLLERQ